METMCELLRQDRAPSELMATYARDDALRGGDEPCTCGSGVPWARCHASLERAARTASHPTTTPTTTLADQ